MTFSSKQQQPAEVLHLKRESYQKSVHLQLLQVLHILCFTDVNCGTEIHFFLVKFMNSTSKNMNQMRQVFEFFIQGALPRIKVSVFPGLRYFAKRNETVLCETVLCEMVLCETVLCEMVLCEMKK